MFAGVLHFQRWGEPAVFSTNKLTKPLILKSFHMYRTPISKVKITILTKDNYNDRSLPQNLHQSKFICWP
jgi:hypothetical protein